MPGALLKKSGRLGRAIANRQFCGEKMEASTTVYRMTGREETDRAPGPP